MADGAVEKLSGKLGIDTTDFKTALSAANRELRVLESGFKASAAALGDWTKDATGLENRVKSLTGQIDIQKLKVGALAAEHARLVQENGANSRAAQDAEIKLNKETETLNKMETELGQTEGALQTMREGEEEAGTGAEEMGEQVEESGNKVETFKSILGGVGVIAKGVVIGLAAVGSAAVAAVVALSALVFKTADYAAELVDLSTKTGISTTRLQELSFIGDQVGTSLDTITGAQARLVRSMNAGREGTGAQADAFKTLGVSVTDAQGNLRDTEEVFAEVIDRLGQVQNPAEADALAMELFGKSAQELNPLIKAGSDEMARLAQEAHDVGAVMSEEDVAAMETFDDTLASLQAGLKGTLGTLASVFLPGFQMVFDQAGGYLQTFKGIVDGSGGDIGKIAEGLGGLLGTIATDIAAQLPQLASVGINIIQTLLTTIIGALPTLITAAVSIINTLVDFIVQNLPMIINAAIQIVMALLNALITNLPMLIEAGLQAIISLATGLADALPELIPAIVEAIVTIVQTLVENIPMLIDAALQLILGLAEGLVAAIPILIPAIPEIVVAIFNALIEALPMIGQAALQLLQTLGAGIMNALPIIGKAAGDIIKALADGVKKLVPTLLTVGKNLLDGIWTGIKNNFSKFLSNILGVFGTVIDAIKTLLGIASPSKVGISIGANLGNSIGVGLFAQLNQVRRSLRGAMGELSAPAFATAGISNVSNSESFAFYAPVTFQGEGGSAGLGAQVKARRF